MSVYDVAKAGFAEGTNELYDAARPSYPAEALSIIHQALPSPKAQGGHTIVEPGSGTGIFSRLILAPPTGYPKFTVKEFVAIEPSSGMRGAWERGWDRVRSASSPPQQLSTGSGAGSAGHPSVRCVDGSFEDLGQAGVSPGSVDLVVVAQAWHWCPDFDKALREISSYLTDRGVLVLVWNQDSQVPAFQREVRALYDEYDRGTPQQYKGWWRSCFDTQAFKESFGSVEERSVDWTVGLTERALTDRILSKSYLTEAYLNGKDRERFLERLHGILERGQDKAWIDQEKGIFRYTYSTDVIVIRRKDP